MHNEMNRITSKPKYKELDFDKLPIEKQSQEWWNYNLARDDSPITDLFSGQLLNRI
jgi:ubiquitin carboxyl-terminal hydrolase 2/21/ubiquitin carboxyl-terminal hydrolase 8